jgi:hypothetical protein
MQAPKLQDLFCVLLFDHIFECTKMPVKAWARRLVLIYCVFHTTDGEAGVEVFHRQGIYWLAENGM